MENELSSLTLDQLERRKHGLNKSIGNLNVEIIELHKKKARYEKALGCLVPGDSLYIQAKELVVSVQGNIQKWNHKLNQVSSCLINTIDEIQVRKLKEDSNKAFLDGMKTFDTSYLFNPGLKIPTYPNYFLEKPPYIYYGYDWGYTKPKTVSISTPRPAPVDLTKYLVPIGSKVKFITNGIIKDGVVCGTHELYHDTKLDLAKSGVMISSDGESYGEFPLDKNGVYLADTYSGSPHQNIAWWTVKD